MLQIILLAAGVYMVISSREISLWWFYADFALFVGASIPSWKSMMDDDGTWWTYTMGWISIALSAAVVFLSVVCLKIGRAHV